jgi:hypothetical protein
VEQSQCLGPLCKTSVSVKVLTRSKIPVLFIIVGPKICDEFQWVMVSASDQRVDQVFGCLAVKIKTYVF